MKIVGFRLMKKFFFLIFYLFASFALANEHDEIIDFIKNSKNVCEVSKSKSVITMLNFDKNDEYLDGYYYGTIKKNKNNFFIILNFKDNYLKRIEIQDKTLHLGIKYNPQKIVLNINCQDIYNSKKLCYKDFVLFNNPNKESSLNQLCYSKLKYKNIPKTSYLPDDVVEYLFANGFNIPFLKDLFKYQSQITNGIVDTF